jgi:lysophospholipase L1-like esterase
MKSVLCFGDSNTYGTPPMASADVQGRFDHMTRWPGVARTKLGPGWHIVEEGLPGRTTVLDDPIEGWQKNGQRYLLACLESHRPLDAVVLMLGTNNLKARFHQPAQDIAASIDILAGIIQSTDNWGRPAPLLLIICPAPILDAGWLGAMFEGGVEKSKRLPQFYREVAQRRGASFLEAGTIIASSEVDGIHFEETEHRKLGEAIAAELERMVA